MKVHFVCTSLALALCKLTSMVNALDFGTDKDLNGLSPFCINLYYVSSFMVNLLCHEHIYIYSFVHMFAVYVLSFEGFDIFLFSNVCFQSIH